MVVKQICDPSGAAILHSLVPTSDLRVLERCGHVITLERPRKTVQILTDFISHHHTIVLNFKKGNIGMVNMQRRQDGVIMGMVWS